jgi:hypothetical protein
LLLSKVIQLIELLLKRLLLRCHTTAQAGTIIQPTTPSLIKSWRLLLLLCKHEMSKANIIDSRLLLSVRIVTRSCATARSSYASL